MKLIALLALLFYGASVASATSAPKRVALIIGNSNYTTNALVNPVNDATLINKTLKDIGFETRLALDLSKAQIKKEVDIFSQKLTSKDTGFFYYAGHAIEFEGQNYLVPVDVDLKVLLPHNVKGDFYSANTITDAMRYAGNKLNIIALDACRDNPFEKSASRSIASRGLAEMVPTLGGNQQSMYISFSTAAGETASDGTGDNSVYTETLAKYLAEPNLEVETLFRKVRTEVSQKTGQIPWSHTAILGEFMLNIKQEADDVLDEQERLQIASLERQKKEEAERKRKEQERLAIKQEEDRKKEEQRIALEIEEQRKERERLAQLEETERKREQERLAKIQEDKRKEEAQRLAKLKKKKQEEERIRLAKIESESQKLEKQRKNEEAKLNKLVATCNNYRSQRNMEKALNCYKKVLVQKPGYSGAISGVQAISDYYETALTKALDKKKLDKAKDSYAMLYEADYSLARSYKNKVDKLEKSKNKKKLKALPTF